MKRDIGCIPLMRVQHGPDQAMPHRRWQRTQPMCRGIQIRKRFPPGHPDEPPIQIIGPAVIRTGQAGSMAHRLVARHQSRTAMPAGIEQYPDCAVASSCEQQRQARHVAGKHAAGWQLVLMTKAQRQTTKQHGHFRLIAQRVCIYRRGQTDIRLVPVGALPLIPITQQAFEQPLPGLPTNPLIHS